MLSQEDKILIFMGTKILYHYCMLEWNCSSMVWFVRACLENGARVLGLDVNREQRTLQLRCGTAIPEVPNVLTRHAVFSLCGRLMGHLPVCGWLHVVASTIKCRASTVIKGWDNKTTDTLLVHMVTETIARVKRSNPTGWQLGSYWKRMELWLRLCAGCAVRCL